MLRRLLSTQSGRVYILAAYFIALVVIITIVGHHWPHTHIR
jgi:hypothetical protein